MVQSGDMPMLKPPAWLLDQVRRGKKGKNSDKIKETDDIVSHWELHTVCESARCPNRSECFSHHTATFLILGDVCTRNCSFCAVSHGHPRPEEPDEPDLLAKAVSELCLSHVVITSVTRDDLDDGGSGHYANVVRKLRQHCPGVKIELLTPDFKGSGKNLMAVLDSSPDIFAHNIETVPRLYKHIRPGADYRRSLGLLNQAKRQYPNIMTKSGIMLGLGEKEEEIGSVLKNLAAAGCEMLTIGQYLAPSLWHHPVGRYVTPEEFNEWACLARDMGFKNVVSGPLVRSSYHAADYYRQMQAGGYSMVLD